jgi:hypothetical protein
MVRNEKLDVTGAFRTEENEDPANRAELSYI